MSKQEDQASLQLSMEVDVLHHQYTATRNPLYAWQCMLLTAQHNADLPQWVSDYLLETGKNLCNLIDTKVERVPIAVAQATGFARESGKSSYFSEFVLLDKTIMLSALVSKYYSEGHKLKHAYEEVNKATGIPVETIREAHERHLKVLLRD